MYRKVRLRLTILCAGITAAIMVIMSLSYLYVSEKALYRNQYDSFGNDMNTIATNLEHQAVISMEWLFKMEAQGNYTFFVLDNGIPFLYNQLTGLSGHSDKYILLKESMEAYNAFFAITPSSGVSSSMPVSSYHTEYAFTSPSTKEDYFGCVINIERGDSASRNSLLQVVIISSMDMLKNQILGQRIRFIVTDIITVILLSAFSFIFTGKLLKPILENQQKQAQFVAAASHELRTPLAVILSSAECCSDASADKRAGFLKTIKAEGLRMSALIDDMLTLSGSDSQNFPIRMEPVELDTLLLNSYEAFENLAREKSLSFSLKLPENSLPTCFCDPDRIRQVISILLHNAISYTHEGGCIRLFLSYKKDCFYISVADNGSGISDEDKKRIFDRFYRAEKSRSAKGHFGLGLSIAYEIIKAHNGNIGVRDADKGGSVFYLTLPENCS